MSKQIWFVNPPTMDNAYRELRRFALAVLPIGMAHIISYLESKNISAGIIDADPLGLSIEDILEKLEQENPKFVGVMAMTATMEIAARLLARLRQTLPRAVLVLGGVHGTALPRRTMEEVPELDVIVMGEGEHTTHELILAVDRRHAGLEDISLEELRRIKGICFRHGGEIYVNERRPYIADLDSLPFPARHLLPVNTYEGPGWFRWIYGYTKPFVSIFSSRGCPFNCNFCAAHTMCGKKVRYRSIENVIAEIDHLVENDGIKILHFQDDTFTLDRKRAIRLCQAMIERNYNFHVLCSTRVDLVDEELLGYMKKAGVEWIFYGVESGNQEILDRSQKGTSLEQIRKAFYLTKQAGIGTHAGMILGHIGETRETAMDTIRFLIKLMPDYAGIATLIPFPGSQAWEHCQRNNIPLPNNWNDYGMVNSLPIAVNPGLDTKTLIKLREKAYLAYYAHPKRLFRLLFSGKYKTWTIIKDHLYNAYALVLRKIRQARKLETRSNSS